MHDVLTMAGAGIAISRKLSVELNGRLQRVCQNWKAEGAQIDGVAALAGRLKLTRLSTYEHSLRVAKLARAAGRAFAFDPGLLQQLSAAALMHDIGKILVPEIILKQTGKPTQLERFILRLHPSFGALIARCFRLPAELRSAAQFHHERWDGRGYPSGLGGADIPLTVRILQVVDAYDAMVGERPYRAPLSHPEALAELREHAGKQFDPRVVEAFLDTFPSTARGDAGERFARVRNTARAVLEIEA